VARRGGGSVSGGAPCLDDRATGMALSVLAEVARMLEALATEGRSDAIDLRSLPLTEADREELRGLLGEGEVRVELDIAGRSTVHETGYAGAWWIRHYGAGDRIASEEIAICSVPDILKSHEADVRAAASRLQHALAPKLPSQAEAS